MREEVIHQSWGSNRKQGSLGLKLVGGESNKGVKI